MTKQDLKIANLNWIKFSNYIQSKYPAPLGFRTAITQQENTFLITHNWKRMGCSDTIVVAELPLYSQCDPNFEPTIFFA